MAKILSFAKKINQKINGEKNLERRLTPTEVIEIREAFKNILLVLGEHDAIISDFLKFENEMTVELRTFFEKRSGKKLDWDLFILCNPEAGSRYKNFPDILNVDQGTISLLQKEYYIFREFLTPFYERLKKGSVHLTKLDLSKSFGLYEEMTLLSESLGQKEELRKTSKLLQLIVLFLKNKIVGEVGWRSSKERQICENFKQFCMGRVDSFEFQEIEDSIRGAFLLAQKPDDQLDILMLKLEEAVVGDPSIPLAMWGYLNGLLAFPKTVMHKITDNHSKIESLYRDYESYFSKFLCKKNNSSSHHVEIKVSEDQTDIKDLSPIKERELPNTVELPARKVFKEHSEETKTVAKTVRRRGKSTSTNVTPLSDILSRRTTRESRKSKEKVKDQEIDKSKIEFGFENLQVGAIIEEAKRSHQEEIDRKKFSKTRVIQEAASIGAETSQAVQSVKTFCSKSEVEFEKLKGTERCEARLLSFSNSKLLLLPKDNELVVSSENQSVSHEQDDFSIVKRKTDVVEKERPSKNKEHVTVKSEVIRSIREGGKSEEGSQLSFDLGE